MPRIFTEKQLVGALHDLLGRLTTKGDTENNAMIVDEFISWASDRGICVREADVKDWNTHALCVSEEVKTMSGALMLRVEQYRLLNLRGQSLPVHGGTSKLINDLAERIEELESRSTVYQLESHPMPQGIADLVEKWRDAIGWYKTDMFRDPNDEGSQSLNAAANDLVAIFAAESGGKDDRERAPRVQK